MSKSTGTLAPPLPSSGATERVGSSAIRDLMALTRRPEVISLAGGLPSSAAWPSPSGPEPGRATGAARRPPP